MPAAGQRAENVSAIELARGQQVQSGGEQSDPSRPPYRMQQQIRMRNAVPQPCFQQPLDERASERRSQNGSSGGNHFGVQDGDGQGGHGNDEADQGTS